MAGELQVEAEAGAAGTGKELGTSPQMSANAEFLFAAVFKGQQSAEVARRFFPTLRQWAETKKAYRGRTFTAEEIEEVIAACERRFAAPAKQGGDVKLCSPEQGAVKPTNVEAVKPASDCWWPRWVLDKQRGVEVLAPAERGKPPVWVRATAVGIGYHGQKKRYLFVRAQKFEMDCRRSEVRMPGGGQAVEELAKELLARGDDPSLHIDWTDGTDSAPGTPGVPDVLGIAPGVAPANTGSELLAPGQLGGDTALLEELEGDFERMALLRRSSLVKSRTCDHPDPLAEPSTAASIKLPVLTERDVVALPVRAAEERLSSLQLETVCFAARRFRMSLPDGRAAGYMLGDGTGCGKGRCISAMICHLWNLGYRRSVWVSATSDLYYDACRDLQDLGADIPCMPMRKLPPSGPLDQKGSEAHKEVVRNLGVEGNGVIFLTYSLLVQTGQRREVVAAPVRTEESRKLLLGGLLDEKMRCVRHVPEFGAGEGSSTVALRPGDRVVGVASVKELYQLQVPFTVSFERVLEKAKDGGESGKDSAAELTAFNSRLGQLVAWLGGSQANGLICFDEVHKAKNLVPDKDERASTKTGLFVDLLQQHCPKAPVLYVSATAATEVQHLGYMSRLGVWGPGTAFENFHDFMKTIEANGVSAMEMFAMNMKAVGAMSCRSLAYVGTEFHTRQCGITEEQLEMYNTACRFWQKLLFEFRRFVDCNDLREAYRRQFFKGMKKQKALEGDGAIEIGKRLWQFYWGAQIRFFKAMCNALKVPAACAAAKEAVDSGEQVLLSIWATGEARSRSKMAHLKDETPGRAIIQSVSEGGLVRVRISDAKAREGLASMLRSDMRLRSDVHVEGQQLARLSRLQQVHGRRATRPADLQAATLPVEVVFRAPVAWRVAVEATLAATGERVCFELGDDALGERVVVARVLEGPASFRRAEQEAWHVKTINDRPVGKVQVRRLHLRLRKGVPIAFQDAVIPEHLSGPQMILEHFLATTLLTQTEGGEELPWAVTVKEQLSEEASALRLPANAMDEILDTLGGVKKVAEMSGRSHRMKRRKDGTLAYVARCEELRCSHDGANMVEQVLFQKGAKKYCIVTEVASAGISLHADRRQVRKDFQPPRRTMISVELPWGADKAIQCFGRVHRANQLVPPRFIMMCTPLGGEVRFISAIARRMKLLGALTKGDRMTSMGGGADQHMSDFDVNNSYGVRALETLYLDTTRPKGQAPELLALYQGLPFLGAEGEGEASGRWPLWEDFAAEAGEVWGRLNLREEFAEMMEKAREDRNKTGTTRESDSVNRFFNRLLMLEVHLQNALFDAFFAIYLELVRIDRANGVYDDGVETLNQSQGRWIRQIVEDRREVLYTDPVSGAETQYVRLRIDRGIAWEAAKAAYDAQPRDNGSAEGFYAFRSREGAQPVYILVKERERVGGAGSSGATWLSRRRRKQYVVWRPDGCARSGHDAGLHTFSADDFSDDRYERIRDDEAALDEVEEGWTQMYASSTTSRLDFEHVLTGDVLSAWRLASGPSKSKSAEGPALKIVRAVVQPSGLPIVGMSVAEKDLPELKYVLSCQHQSTREEPHEAKMRPSIRDVCVKGAEALVAKLSDAKDGTLQLTSWLDVHKQLAADELVPRSVDGLRGVQQAVERLVRRGFIAIEGGTITLKGSPGKIAAEELELKLFPEEFVVDEEAQDEGSEDEGSDAGSCEGPPDDDMGAEGASDTGLDPGGAGEPPRQKKDRHRALKSAEDCAQGAKRKALRAISTPAKARKTKQDAASKSSRPKEPKRRRRKKEASASSDAVGSDDMFAELFGSDMESADAGEEEPCAKADPVPSGARKRQGAEMAKTLFGDTAEMDGAAADKKTEDGGTAVESARGLWTYEVTGNKLGIRKSPDVGKVGAGYLSPGEFFKVTEQRQGKDGRTYLRLADGRGWAYDRSAKDIEKVVVRLIKSQ